VREATSPSRGRFAFTDMTEGREADDLLRVQAAALEAAANAIVITDREGRIQWTNPAFTRLTGWSPDEARGQNPRILKSGTHGTSFYEHLWRTVLSGEIWRAEMVNRRKDGSLYVEEQTITPVRGAQGEITHFIGVKVDVSERRAAREALLQSERRYRTLAEAAHDDIFILDREGRIAYLNGAAAARLGRHPDEAAGKELNQVFPDEVAARFRGNIERVLASGQALYAEDRAVFEGSEAHIGTWLTPLEGEEGRIESVMGISRDITVQLRAEQALKASEERYRSLFERNLAGVYRTSLDGRILECNEAFVRIFGYRSRADLRGLGAAELYRRPEAREALLDRLRAEGAVVNYESEGRTRDGAAVWMLENASVVEDGAPEGPCIEGTIVDLTEHKRLERQLQQAQKMEAVGQLAGGVAHDFNNLLAVIGGYSELALRRIDQPDALRRYIEEIRTGVTRAAGLTRQLLAFGRQQVVEPTVLDVDEVLRGLEGMLRRLIREDIDLVTRLGASPALVKTDRGQIEQVVVNLVVNARDAMPEGGRLTIQTVSTELDEVFCRRHVEGRPGAHVMLAVSDTGIGMDAETRSHVFEPFFTTKEPGKGTGLGLSTVYGIVKQAGGSVWVYSEPGQGAIFKVFLPRADEAEAGPRAAMASGPAPGGTERVLLVEDEEALRVLTRELLESLGYAVREARHGLEALAASAALEERIDLLVTDMVMPGMSGPELASRLAGGRPEMQVLFVSGYAEAEGARHDLAESRVAFLQKPFTSEALAHRIRELLDRPREHQSAGSPLV
jgi:two-component system, cell cycle sensor histidine kinase and response regulator CckA